mgnify:CR=1 FL=1
MERRSHLHLLAVVALGTLAAAAVCAVGVSALLRLPAVLAAALLRGYLTGAVVMAAAAAAALWAALWPVPTQLGPLSLHPDSPRARAAKTAVLGCPLWVATAGTGAGLFAAVTGALVLTEQGGPPSRVLAILGLAMTQVGMWGLLLYGLMQRAMAPLLYPLRAAAAPASRWRIEAELQGFVSYALLAVVSAALLPAFVLATLHPAPRPGAGALLLGATVAGLLGLALIIALGIGSRLRRELTTLSLTAKRLLEARLDQQVRLLIAAPPAAIAEVEVLHRALFDLVERARRLQVEIFLATERTIEARRAKSQHLAATSHDLRNALSPVLGFTDLLAGGYEGELPPAGQLRIKRMQQKGRRQLRILSEILDTAKIESQTIDLHPRECSPAELLAQAMSEVRRLRSLDVLPVRMELEPELPLLAVDPVRFPQALSYLCGHILDTLEAEAESEARSDGELLTDGELLLRACQIKGGTAVMFEVAYIPDGRRKKSRAAAGGECAVGPALGTSGLGLALPLARQLLALHGGSVAVVAGEFPRLRATFPLLPRAR